VLVCFVKITLTSGAYKGVGQIMETLQILYKFLYYYGVGPPFALSTAAILGMDSF
jgi:hypothetical protein